MLTDCESGRARRASAAEGSLFNLEGAGDEVCGKKIAWGYSSAGRAPALQAGGRRFDPDYLHHPTKAYAFAGTLENLKSSGEMDSPCGKVLQSKTLVRRTRGERTIHLLRKNKAIQGPVAQLARAYD